MTEENFSYHHHFHIRNGYCGNIDWKENNYQYIGIMYITSKCSEHKLWSDTLDGVFENSEEMLEHAELFLRSIKHEDF